MGVTGAFGAVLIGKETTWGTEVAPSKDIGLVQSLDHKIDNSLEAINAIGTRNIVCMNEGPLKLGGSISAYYQNGRIFEYIFGRQVVHTVTGSDIKHEFISGAAEDASFTMQDALTAHTENYVLRSIGCKIKSFTLKSEFGKVTSWDADFINKGINTTATKVDAVVSNICSLNGNMAHLFMAGTEVSEVQNFTFTIDTGIKDDAYGLGSRFLQEIPEGPFNLTWKATITLTQQSWDIFRQKMLGNDTNPSAQEFEIILDITNGKAAGSGLRQIHVKFNGCYINAFSKPESVNDKVVVDFDGMFKSIGEFYNYDDIVGANW